MKKNNFFGVSTSWNAKRGIPVNEVLEEFKKANVRNLELDPHLSEDDLFKILKLVESEELNVLSLHNFCPKPEIIPEGRSLHRAYLISSEDAEERKKAVFYTKRTIDWAVRLNAEVIVLHAGEVPVNYSQRFMYESYLNGDIDKFYQLRNAIVEERKNKQEKYLKNTIESLKEIVDYGVKKGIVIGLENRFYVNEIPNFEEIGLILENFKQGIEYWHDTGHAEIWQSLGYGATHEEFLKKYNPVGMHLHDVKGVTDHWAPGAGIIDFKKVFSLVNNDVKKVVEVHPKVSFSELTEGINYIVDIGNRMLSNTKKEER